MAGLLHPLSRKSMLLSSPMRTAAAHMETGLNSRKNPLCNFGQKSYNNVMCLVSICVQKIMAVLCVKEILEDLFLLPKTKGD